MEKPVGSVRQQQRQESVAGDEMLHFGRGRNAGGKEQCWGKVHSGEMQRHRKETIAGGEDQRCGKDHDGEMQHCGGRRG